MPRYSIIIPIYNRPQEAKELMESLSHQNFRDFELVIVEDGSSAPSKTIVEEYADQLDIHYFFIENSGPGLARNYGMQQASGDWMLFFDSDCLIPEQYLEVLDKALQERQLDAYGGPDNAHPSFSTIQKAINHSMTSFLTTGGIRGRKKQLDQYQPRSFNMGFRREVYEKVGGFSTLHPGEDPDLSYRIKKAGFKVGLVPEAFVYHKRRIDFSKFYTQVNKFGMVRVILGKWHPGTFKLVYLFPSLFLLGSLLLIVLGLVLSPHFFWPLVAFALLIFLEALFLSKNVLVAMLAIIASFVQLWGYGWGLIKAGWQLWVLNRPEREAFPRLFFD